MLICCSKRELLIFRTFLCNAEHFFHYSSPSLFTTLLLFSSLWWWCVCLCISYFISIIYRLTLCSCIIRMQCGTQTTQPYEAFVSFVVFTECVQRTEYDFLHSLHSCYRWLRCAVHSMLCSWTVRTYIVRCSFGLRSSLTLCSRVTVWHRLVQQIRLVWVVDQIGCIFSWCRAIVLCTEAFFNFKCEINWDSDHVYFLNKQISNKILHKIKSQTPSNF